MEPQSSSFLIGPVTPDSRKWLRRHSVVTPVERAASLIRLRRHRWRKPTDLHQPSSLSPGLASWEGEGGQLR